MPVRIPKYILIREKLHFIPEYWLEGVERRKRLESKEVERKLGGRKREREREGYRDRSQDVCRFCVLFEGLYMVYTLVLEFPKPMMSMRKHHSHSPRTAFVLIVAAILVCAVLLVKGSDDCFCTGRACCPTSSEPKIKTACQVKELYKFLAQEGQLPLGKGCSDYTGYAAVSCKDKTCTDIEESQNQEAFQDSISVSASILVSANTYTEASGCASLLYVPTPSWPDGPCNPIAWFSSSDLTYLFLLEVWIFDPNQDISALADKLASLAGLFLTFNSDTDTGKVVFFDLVSQADSKIEYGSSNFNALISNVPLAEASSLFSADSTISTFYDPITNGELFASSLNGGWYDPFSQESQDANRPDLIGYRGGTFAPFAPQLAERAPFLNRLSSSTINALKILNTYEITGCPFGKITAYISIKFT